MSPRLKYCLETNDSLLQFRTDFIKEGFNGGKKVASLLLQTVRDELASRNPLTAHQVQIVVRIFADVQGLATTYSGKCVSPHTAVFGEFVRGFNVGDAMCDFLDVGREKGRSDEKIQGTATISLSKLCQALTI